MQQTSKLNMLVVCQDEQYLKSIEYRLAQALVDKVDISYISDYECLKIYNTQPKDIDILLIDESLYKEVISRQNCKNIYLLVEDENKADRQNEVGNNNIIYKYSSIRVIIDKIDSKLLQNRQNTSQASSKVVTVYSPIGGCGKTTVAIGLAYQLGMKGYKVLYLGTESLQDYQKIVGETEYMPEHIGYQCNMQISRAAEEMLKHVKKCEFEYFPAWKRMLPAYGIKIEHLLEVATYIQKKNVYDYIVVELSCEVYEAKLNFMYQSDRIVLVVKQDEESVGKLKQFLSNIVEWKGMGVIVCNFYDNDNEDYLMKSQGKLRYSVCECINKFDSEKFMTNNKLKSIDDLHILEKTAMVVS